MNIFQESSLNDSLVFNALNKQSTLTALVQKCIKDSIMITPLYIEEQLLQIKRSRISPLSDKVLEAYEKGRIVIVYSKVVKVPQAIPFMIIKSQGGLKAFIFVNNYGTLTKNEKGVGHEYLSMPMKDLYVLMEGAYTALEYYAYPIQITKNLGLMKISSMIYTSMILRILNKEYAISMDITTYNRVSFCISKFFLDNIWESKNKDINTTYAMNNINNPNKADLLILNDSYESANITNIDLLISFLKTVTPRLEKLNLRYFTQCYLNTYKPSAIFSMECLPYFLYTIEAALVGSFIVNQPIISDITKNIKNITTFYAELSKVI